MAKELQPKTYTNAKGNLVIEGIPVFRSGEFADSTGFRQKWEPLHIDMMKTHYDMLTKNKILNGVPVRDGHPGFLIHGTPGTGKVIGWHTGLSAETRTSQVDGKEYSYLLADFELTDPAARESYQNGTYRNRSAEIGEYVTNDEATFWPVYQGFAFVDFSAVEGLQFAKEHPDDSKLVVMFEKGSTVTDAPPVPAPPVPPTATAPVQLNFGGKVISDPAEAQKQIDALFTNQNTLQAKVTAHENAEKERSTQVRKDFVAQLVKDNKIMAPTAEANESFALGLSEEQWASWSAMMTGMPVAGPLGTHSQTAPGSTVPVAPATAPTNEPTTQEEQIAILEETVESHFRASTPGIKEFTSYKELLRLAPQSPILAKIK